jgi:signal transduction histidine kinase
MLAAKETQSSWRMGILARLFLLVVIALAPVTAIQIYDELERRGAREAELHAEVLRLATLVGMEQDRILEGSRQIFITLSQLRGVRTRDKRQCAELFDRLGKSFPQYAYVATMDLQGAILCSTAGELSREALMPHQPFFWTPIVTGDFAVGRQAVMADGTRVLQLGFPISDRDGSVVGIALAGLRADWLSSRLAKDILPPDAILHVADRDGIVIAQLPRADLPSTAIGQPLPPDRASLVHAALLGTFETRDASGARRIFGYNLVEAAPGEGVYIEVGLDRDDAFAAIDRSTARHGVAIAAALAIGGVLSWLGFHYFLRRPTTALLRASKRWRRGDWTARAGTGDGGTEFARLGHSFDQMAEAIAQRERALIKAKDEAEAANRAKSSFLANMSHELRTPLNAIIGFSEVINGQKPDPASSARYREYAHHIHASGQHLLRLVNDILDLSKLAAGQMELTESLVDLEGLLRDCVRLVLAQARARSVTIDTDVAASVPPVMAGELRLKQVLVNLLSNAVKFSHDGGAVGVSVRLIETGDLAIVVSDHGIGMKPEDIPVALEPFRQIDNTLSRVYDGTGLGLPLAKKLMEMHGGTLGVESMLGRGTTVTVTLPRARLRPSPPPAAAASA